MKLTANAGSTFPKNKTDAAASGVAAVITIPADANEFWVLDSIHFSSDTAISNADTEVKVEFGSSIKWICDMGNEASSSSFREILFPGGLTNAGVKNEELKITAEDPGAAGLLKLNVIYR